MKSEFNPKDYIKNVKWSKSKHMGEHEYTISTWSPELRSEFVQLAQLIRDTGYKKIFGKTTYIYLNLDGYKYWTAGAAMNKTICLNRSKQDA